MAGQTAQEYWQQQIDAGVVAFDTLLITQYNQINPVVPTAFNIGVATVQNGQGLSEPSVGP